MKNGQEIYNHVVDRIAAIYSSERPLMYGGTAHGIEQMLRTYHKLWAFIVDRDDALRIALDHVYEEEGCSAASFDTRYRWDHANASEGDVAQYVISRWKRVSSALDIINEP